MRKMIKISELHPFDQKIVGLRPMAERRVISPLGVCLMESKTGFIENAQFPHGAE